MRRESEEVGETGSEKVMRECTVRDRDTLHCKIFKVARTGPLKEHSTQKLRVVPHGISDVRESKGDRRESEEIPCRNSKINVFSALYLTRNPFQLYMADRIEI